MKYLIGKKLKALIIAIITSVSLLFIIYFVSKPLLSKNKTISHNYKTDCNRSEFIPDSVKLFPTNVLNDKNDVHLAYAQAFGLQKLYTSRLEFEDDSAQMVKEGKLIHIKNNPLFHITELKHSYPFLIPEMVDLLNEIAYNFNKNLPEQYKNDFKIVITSALRTNETQLYLSKSNRNASPVSAHLFGTTVDISYKVFWGIKQDTLVSDYYAVQALTKSLQDLRMKCRFATVKERRQACFHTTVNPCNSK